MTREELIENGIEEEVIDAFINCYSDNESDLDNLEEAYQGQYKNDEEFVQQLLEDCGDIPSNLPSYVYIDWERTANDVMMDYAEDNGYYFRQF